MTLIAQYITSAMLMSIATNDNYDFSKAKKFSIFKKTNYNIGKEHLSNIRRNYIEKTGFYVHSFIW